MKIQSFSFSFSFDDNSVQGESLNKIKKKTYL